jgi:hypothetical protein
MGMRILPGNTAGSVELLKAASSKQRSHGGLAAIQLKLQTSVRMLQKKKRKEPRAAVDLEATDKV